MQRMVLLENVSYHFTQEDNMKITPESIQDFCLSAGVWVTRSQIAKAHNKRKTTHVVTQIAKAVSLDLIIEENGFDAFNMPCKVYHAVWYNEQ